MSASENTHMTYMWRIRGTQGSKGPSPSWPLRDLSSQRKQHPGSLKRLILFDRLLASLFHSLSSAHAISTSTVPRTLGLQPPPRTPCGTKRKRVDEIRPTTRQQEHTVLEPPEDWKPVEERANDDFSESGPSLSPLGSTDTCENDQKEESNGEQDEGLDDGNDWLESNDEEGDFEGSDDENGE